MSNPHPLEVKEQVRALFRAGLSYRAIERQTGVTQHTIRKWFGPAKLRDPAVKYAEIVRLRRQEGLTNRQIADKLGIPDHQVRHYLGRTPVRLGGRHDWHPMMMGRAQYLRECGYTVTEIAEQTGVPRSTIGDWVHGMPCDY